MAKIVGSLLDGVDTFLAWLGASFKQSIFEYCDIETADDVSTLVSHDGSLLTIIKVSGVRALIGTPEFNRLHEGLTQTLHTAFAHEGHSLQVLFNYDPNSVKDTINHMYEPAKYTASRLNLELDDLFEERANYLSRFCADEDVHLVLWTRPAYLTKDQLKRSLKQKGRMIADNKIPPFLRSQNILAGIKELRDAHNSFVKTVANDLDALLVDANVVEVHDAVRMIRMSVDREFTDRDWRPLLPGDKISSVKDYSRAGNISDIFWPSLSRQIFPRDAENIDMRTARIGDNIYSSVFIDLFPKDIKPFVKLFQRTLFSNMPWRISFWIESGGMRMMGFKQMITPFLVWTSAQNRLIDSSMSLLKYIDLNTDDSVVRLRVAACTWAPQGDLQLLRTRASELAKAIEGWGSCDVSEISGDPFGGVLSSALGVMNDSHALPSLAPLSDAVYMLPMTRPSSPWKNGALLFRSPDGKLWPFQPGSALQNTWIDLFYARPGSGKSVASNAINLALCLRGGIQRLPRIAIIDIGPSSSGLISLLKEALPQEKRHLAVYSRLRMTPEFSINPFDTQLGSRYPTPSERGFLTNFLTLIVTPIGSERPYDGMPDLAGMVIDELYKSLADDAQGNPHVYVPGREALIDGLLEEIGFMIDSQTTWWEVTDALFLAGFVREAGLAQRYAMPLLADATSICRTPAIEDLYSKITTPTGENLIEAFNRMVSSAIREYPILSRPTCFDLSEARIVSLDLDEVAKTGGESADRQTAVMYMLARYVLARHYYLTEDNAADMPEQYRSYHSTRIAEIREDDKRIVYDEFHRTSRAQAVRDQVIVDMREGRKWKVQIALLSQSLEDFDETMVEFATAVYIMDAGPGQTVDKTAKVFGLSDTAKVALRTRVSGPREGGATFLAQYAVKGGIDSKNTQLLTSTLGPVELWAFSTTAEDALLRNKLYHSIGPKETRRILATLFPKGSVAPMIEKRMNELREERGLIEEENKTSLVVQLYDQILEEYKKNPDVKRLPI